MTAREVLAKLRSRGVTVRRSGRQLRMSGPKEAIAAMVDVARANKGAILALLETEELEVPPICAQCGTDARLAGAIVVWMEPGYGGETWCLCSPCHGGRH